MCICIRYKHRTCDKLQTVLEARVVAAVFRTDLGSWTASPNNRCSESRIVPISVATGFVLDTLSSSELIFSDPRSSYAH